MAGTPRWSPDGGSIAFERDGQLYVVAADGANERRLRSGFAPAWSPDGRLLVFAIRGDVCALDLATGRARAVVYDVETSDRYYGNAKPAWQPTGASAGWCSTSSRPIPSDRPRRRALASLSR